MNDLKARNFTPLDDRAEIIEALEEERDLSHRIEAAADEACARLDRISEHLHTLAVWVKHGGPDPWPEREPEKPKRKKHMTPNACYAPPEPKP